MRRARTGGGRRLRQPDDRGSVVAEFAVALPAVAIVLALGVGALAGASRQVRLQDAVADAARLSARGEPVSRVTEAVVAAVAEASVEIAPRGDLVCVTATAPTMLGLRVQASGCALAGGL
ncbi:TadE family type IV pilus minor pilin [Microbacterium sp. NPDC058389]|uniref:TadE family type IV pilus minor pilin n=1 Tax=Microbacterium sp. NPDC058389 TaxID=3346475 RepID=UPI00365173E4